MRVNRYSFSPSQRQRFERTQFDRQHTATQFRVVIKFEFQKLWSSHQKREPCSVSTGPHLRLTCRGRQQPQLCLKLEPWQEFKANQFRFPASQSTPTSTPPSTPQNPREYWHQDLATLIMHSLQLRG
jgi:hypothetical protein